MKKILIIDDEPSVRIAVRMCLRKNTDYDIIEAESGEEGIALARAKLPDLVLSDVNMDAMNGFDVLQTLRTQSETSKIPVILMSSGPSDIQSPENIEREPDDFLPLPFKQKRLLSAVQNRLNRRDALEILPKGEAKVLDLLSFATDFIAFADPINQTFFYLNRAGRKMLGIGLGEDVFKFTLSEFIAYAGMNSKWREMLDRVNQCGVATSQCLFKARGGRIIPTALKIFSHESLPGKSSFWHIVARDVTKHPEPAQIKP
jgi:CheY-like chemotaxis protein